MSINHVTLPIEIQKRLQIAFAQDGPWPLPGLDTEQNIEIKIKSGRHETVISEFIKEIIWKGTRLMVTICDSAEHHIAFEDALTHEQTRTMLSGTLNEYRIRAILGSRTGLKNEISRLGASPTGTFKATLTFLNWIVESKKAVPQFWAADVSDGIRIQPGNLSITIGTRNYFAYKFDGLYEYYILPEKKRIMINLRAGQKLDSYKLAQDQMVLSYVLGQRINFNNLVGFDDNAIPCAEVASLLFEQETPSGWKSPPVPTIESDGPEEILNDEIWEVPLFRCCSSAVQSSSKIETSIAIMNYIDSLTGNIIPAYLQTQVGLEAFSRSILASAGKLPRETSIRVQKAFEHYGLNLTADALLEIRRRNTIVHEMMVSKAHGRMDGSEIKRIAILRLLLNILIVKAIGYDGKIRHWRTDFRNGVVASPNPTVPATPVTPLWTSDSSTRTEAGQKYLARLEVDKDELPGGLAS